MKIHNRTGLTAGCGFRIDDGSHLRHKPLSQVAKPRCSLQQMDNRLHAYDATLAIRDRPSCRCRARNRPRVPALIDWFPMEMRPVCVCVCVGGCVWDCGLIIRFGWRLLDWGEGESIKRMASCKSRIHGNARGKMVY